MQDRYVGDIGDYIKLSLLKALAPGKKLGVAWYRNEAVAIGGDGCHDEYLDGRHADRWVALDGDLHAKLKLIRHEKSPSLVSLEGGLIPGDVKFHGVNVPRGLARDAWFASLTEFFEDRDLIFADPDNGIEPDGFHATSAKATKSITYAEIWRLRFPARALVVYHHQTHFKGGHENEIRHIGERLRKFDIGCVAAIRAGAWSPRVFFLIGFDQHLWEKAKAFAENWHEWLKWYELTGPPDALGLPPHDPFSMRAERGIEKFANQLAAGEYDNLFDRKHPRSLS